MAVTLTEAAKARVAALNAKAGVERWLRVGVRGGGCSGFKYDLSFVDAPLDGDKRFEVDGVKLCVERKSYLFLNGTTIGFEQTAARGGFVFDNPSAERTCSCGESFSVAM
jgi:iron-sulfur cluster assembly protein